MHVKSVTPNIKCKVSCSNAICIHIYNWMLIFWIIDVKQFPAILLLLVHLKVDAQFKGRLGGRCVDGRVRFLRWYYQVLSQVLSLSCWVWWRALCLGCTWLGWRIGECVLMAAQAYPSCLHFVLC